MYCSHCGKKVTDTMLFCPFCGDPIVIPDQDEDIPSLAGEGLYYQNTTADQVTMEKTEEKKTEVGKENDKDEIMEWSTDKITGNEEDSETAPWPTDAEWEAIRAELENDDADITQRDAKEELEQWNNKRSHLSNASYREDSFSPLKLKQDEQSVDWLADIERKKEAVVLEKKPPDVRTAESPSASLSGRAPKLKKKKRGNLEDRKRKHANTLVPERPLDPDELFGDVEGGIDNYDRKKTKGDSGSAYSFDDEEENSFFMKHIRGFVGLALLLILALMVVIYAFSKAGQLSLARINLAWSVSAYSQLGYNSSEAGDYAQAGMYYERALARDQNNYDLASAAAMAYIQSENEGKATQMLKRCIELKPEALEPYLYLLQLYPDSSNRPWEISRLIQQGYQMTGDPRLNVTG